MSEDDRYPYQRIVRELTRRITAGELRPGDRLPSTRQLMRDFHVAMATATKALSVLRHQGWASTVPGSATVVKESRPRGGSRTAGRFDEPSIHRDELVRTAIELVDTDGWSGLSMRRLAAVLDIGVMSLYRHVPDKEELIRIMADTAFGEVKLPEPGPTGWRAKLELCAHTQWSCYRRHPWLAPVLLTTLTDPPTVSNGMRHVDWQLRAMSDLGMDARTMLLTVVTLNGYVGGMAMTRSEDVESENVTGMNSAQRRKTESALFAETLHRGQFSTLEAVGAQTDDLDLDELFDFGLQRHLDGIAAKLSAVAPA